MAVKLDRKKIANYLAAGHAMLAKLPGIPFAPYLEISEGEADVLGEAWCGVLEQYDITINPKVAAWVTLIGTCAVVYGPRFAVYQAVRGQSAPSSTESGQVVPFPGGMIDGMPVA